METTRTTGRRSYVLEDAVGWLRRIAVTAEANGGEVAWWQLYRGVQRARLLVALTTALLILTISAVETAVIRQEIPLLVVIFAVAGGVVVWFSDVPERPIRLNAAAARRPRDLADALGPASACAALGALLGIDSHAWAYGVIESCFLALLLFPLGNPGGRLFRLMAEHLDPARALEIRGTRNDDRAAAVLRGITLGVLSGWALGLLLAVGVQGGGGITPLPGDPKAGLATGIGLAVTVFVTVAFGRSCWGWYVVCRLWAAARRNQPLSLLGFLEDAEDRGVLRRSGLAYQFRHAAVQDRLLQGTRTASDGASHERRAWPLPDQETPGPCVTG
jgi:hypothetical protein